MFKNIIQINQDRQDKGTQYWTNLNPSSETPHFQSLRCLLVKFQIIFLYK